MFASKATGSTPAAVCYLLALLVLCCVVLSAVQAQQAHMASERPARGVPLTFFVSDFGINQYRDDLSLRTGDDFANARACVFPSFPRDAQILIVMPPHEQLGRMSDSEVTDEILGALKTRVDSGLSRNVTTYEVQVIEHIGTVTYASDGHQQAVNRFGRCAYEAIGMLRGYLSEKGHSDQAFHGVLGSNGTKVFSENVSAWKGYMTDATFFDGRAYKTPMVETIRALGEGNVRIFNTAGDWPAPNYPWVHSIGNHDVTKDLKRMFPGLTVGWIDPLDRLDHVGNGHLAAMKSEQDPRFFVKFWQGNSYSTPVRMSSAQLAPGCAGSAHDTGPGKSMGKESGVSMKETVGPESFTRPLPSMQGVQAGALRKELTDTRPSPSALNWLGTRDGEANAEEGK